MMSLVGDFISEKVAFGWLQFQIVFSKLVKDDAQVAEVWENDYIVKVDEAVH